jgi:hypothetical protein
VSASKWRDNLFELGLLNAGFTLVARLQGVSQSGGYITNNVIDGVAQHIRFLPLSGTWTGLQGFVGTDGRPFPYGLDVEPPE